MARDYTEAMKIDGTCATCGRPIRFRPPATLLRRSCARCRIKPSPEDSGRTELMKDLRERA